MYIFTGEIGLQGPVGESGIKGTKGDQGEMKDAQMKDDLYINYVPV